MYRKMILTLAVITGLALATGILVFLNPSRTTAAPSVRYVEPTGNCGGASPCYSSIQSALDAAMPGNVIKVATGIYPGVHAYTDTNTLVTQTLFIDKSIVLTGGYTITNWSSPDAAAYPVTLDAQYLGRVIYITGATDVEIDGLRLIHGNGGIFIGNQSTVELGNSVILSSTTWYGAAYPGHGILNNGSLTLVNSSIVSTTEQSLLSWGVGVYNLGNTNIFSATIRDNTTNEACAGIANAGSMNVFTATIQNNIAAGYNGRGGGICNWGSFYLAGSSILNNKSLLGGGIANEEGNMIIVNTTISGNGGWYGSGIANYPMYSHSVIMTITNSTIVSNTGGPYDDSVGLYGIYNTDHFGRGFTPTLSIKNTIVAYNPNPNCFRMITSLGHNIEDRNSCGFNNVGDLINIDPGLGPLDNYGGPTLTYSLEPDSPAINAGDNSGCPPIDQRGVHRPQGTLCDIGAFELPELFLPIITVH